MPSEQATQTAKHIFDDLQRSGYYADPTTLGGFLKGPQGTDADDARSGRGFTLSTKEVCTEVPDR